MLTVSVVFAHLALPPRYRGRCLRSQVTWCSPLVPATGGLSKPINFMVLADMSGTTARRTRAAGERTSGCLIVLSTKNVSSPYDYLDIDYTVSYLRGYVYRESSRK